MKNLFVITLVLMLAGCGNIKPIDGEFSVSAVKLGPFQLGTVKIGGAIGDGKFDPKISIEALETEKDQSIKKE